MNTIIKRRSGDRPLAAAAISRPSCRSMRATRVSGGGHGTGRRRWITGDGRFAGRVLLRASVRLAHSALGFASYAQPITLPLGQAFDLPTLRILHRITARRGCSSMVEL